MEGKKILIIITGGIAAYKVLDLIRRLRERGVEVRCVLTEAATNFVTPLSVAALSEHRVYQDLFSLTDEAEMGHIRLSRDSDLVVIAPATANILAKMAAGPNAEIPTAEIRRVVLVDWVALAALIGALVLKLLPAVRGATPVS